MKYGIVGNREGWDEKFVAAKIDEIISNDKTEVIIISGGAKGIDAFAENYAVKNKIRCKLFMPDYGRNSPQRYFERNRKIAEACDILIAFDKKAGRSGTKNTIRHAKELNKEVILIKSQ